MPRKKADGIASIVAKEDPVSIQELTMQDFFAAFALGPHIGGNIAEGTGDH